MNVIYARQSIDKKDSLSIESQIDQCRKFAGNNAKIFKDKGYSGKNIKRPAFTELIRAIESGEVKKIFVYRLDRFSRSIADFSRLWELLDKHGVEFYSATENFDTSTPIGRAMLNIILVFAQLERETTAKRVKDNYLHRFLLGAWPGGPAPFGYNLTKTTVNGTQICSLIANEDSTVVKEIFIEYARPESSLRSIAKHLKENGVHAPKREVWDNVTLSRILHNPIYVKADKEIYWFFLSKGIKIYKSITEFDGEYSCNIIGKRDRGNNKYNAPEEQIATISNHKGFINSDLWLAVQNKLDNNQQISRANAGKYSWLTGLMKCSKCGYAIKINYNKKENKCNLICSGKSNFSICNSTINIDLYKLENYISKEINKMLIEAPPENMVSDTKINSLRLITIEEKIERLITALSECNENLSHYILNQIETLHKERESITNDIKNKEQSINKIDFTSLEFNNKKLIASQFIDRILINDVNVEVKWKI